MTSHPAVAQLTRLAAIMAQLRDPVGGCPWDLQQSFATIVPYTIEEAYEVADAVAANDMPGLCEELGDLLLQVVFHAQMASEAGAFDLADVICGIADKMERRHPHVFGDAGVSHVDGEVSPGKLPEAGATGDAAAVTANWESLKAREKPRAGALAGVALALPALMRADKLQRRAARVGFDWPDASGPRAKIAEELAEFDAAVDDVGRVDEGGDLLFAVVNYLRHHGVDPEVALRGANAKFEARYAAMEAGVADFAGLDMAAKERLWEAAKRL